MGCWHDYIPFLLESDQIEKIVNAGGVEGIPEVGTPTLLELGKIEK